MTALSTSRCAVGGAAQTYQFIGDRTGTIKNHRQVVSNHPPHPPSVLSFASDAPQRYCPRPLSVDTIAMQFFTTVATLAVAVVGSVTAMPSPPPGAGECSTGTVRCCDNAEPASSDKSQIILEALGLYSPDSPTEGSIGLSCSPVASPVGDSQSWSASLHLASLYSS